MTERKAGAEQPTRDEMDMWDCVSWAMAVRMYAKRHWFDVSDEAVQERIKDVFRRAPKEAPHA